MKQRWKYILFNIFFVLVSIPIITGGPIGFCTRFSHDCLGIPIVGLFLSIPIAIVLMILINRKFRKLETDWLINRIGIVILLVLIILIVRRVFFPEV